MKKSLFIALKEVRDFFQDKGDLAFSLILPILIFGLMYGAFGNNIQFNGTAYIVNEDTGGQYATQILERLQTYDGLTVRTLSAEDANSRLDRSNIQIAAFIPEDFSEKLAAGQPSEIVFKQRGNGGTEGQIVASLVRSAADEIGQSIQVLNQVKSDLAESGISSQQIEVTVQQIMSEEASNQAVTITDTSIGSNPDPINQFLPGILTMFVLFAVNLTAQALVDERRKGTLERLLTTRLKTGELFFGKFLAYTARGFVQTTILLLLAYAVFSLFTPLSFLEALVVALVFAAACATIGLIIGSISRSQNQATWFSVFFTMLMVMLSGTFVAVSEGTVMGTLSKFSINTYANDAFRSLIAEGGSLADVRMEMLIMLGVAVIGLIISRFLFRVTQEGK